MKKFYVGVKGVISSNNQVLLLRTNAAQGRGDRWEFPGGRIDGDETIEQALERELREELPNIITFQIHEVLDAHRVPKDIDGETSLFLVFYRVTAEFPNNIELSEEHVSCGWFGFEEARNKVEDGLKPAITMLEGEPV